jgi:integrase
VPKLTKRFVDAAKANKNGSDAVFWDDAVTGFGLRVKASGVKSWLVQYRNAHGVSRRLTLGRVGVMTPDQARREAKQKLAAVDRGQDPAEETSQARKAKTVAQLCDEYLKAEANRIKPSTLAMDRSRIEAHVKPLLGSRPVASLKPADLERFLHDVLKGKTAKKLKPGKRPRGGLTVGGPGVASRTFGMLGTILQRAVRDGLLANNPARGIKRPTEETAPPAFSFDRVKQVGDAMRAVEAEEGEALAVAKPGTLTGLRAVRCLILTGCRRMEILTLQWGDVDFSSRCFRFRDTKTGKQVRPVGRAALDHLASFKPSTAKPTDHVVPGASKAGHCVGLPKAWARIADAAKASDVSIHGLRHWFASAAAEMNYSDFVIGGLLGHAKRGVTGRYANTPDAALCSAADRVSQRLCDALNGKARGEVVELRAAGTGDADGR